MDSKAYTEVNYLINEMSEEMKNKIPINILENIKNRMDKNYNFTIENQDFENAKLLDDTEKILSVLYTDYFATEEEKEVIRNKERLLENKRREENKKIELNEIFPNKKKETKEEVSLVVTKEEKWYKKLIDNFIKLFKRK